MSKTKNDEEKLFYLKLASKEKYKARELERQIDSGYFERLMLSDGKAPSAVDRTESMGMIRNLYMLELQCLVAIDLKIDDFKPEYTLSRNMTYTMISEYRTKLISKEILQKKLEELYDAMDDSNTKGDQAYSDN